MIVGLIPARSGSERIPDKNIRELAGHPLLAYSIASALESKLFNKVIVSTDSPLYADIAQKYGALVIMRPERFAMGASPDFEWVGYTIAKMTLDEPWDRPHYYAILRPTSPFRSVGTILRAWEEWDHYNMDSIRAVEPVKQHPGKMWIVRDRIMYPLLSMGPEDPPFHSSQMKSLPKVYVQNASLEFSTVEALSRTKTISGWKIQPFITEGWEGYDINYEEDWELAEKAVIEGVATLPDIKENHGGEPKRG